MIYRDGKRVVGFGDAAEDRSAPQPPERTDWKLVAVCAVALVTVTGGFVWGIQAAGR
jgi:hypothetical protein